MKSVIFALIVAVALIVPARAMSCGTQPERCTEEECCVEFGIFGKCRPLVEEGKKCELRPMKTKLHNHIYMMKCPCGEGLMCEEDDSRSLHLGTCVATK